MAKDDIRSAIFNNANFKREVFSFFGQDIELRQPTVGQIGKLAENKGDKNRLIEILIESSYVPGSDEKIFTAADYTQLMDIPGGDWILEFTKAWNKLAGNVQDAEKN